MKHFFALLLLCAFAAGPARAQSRPKGKAKRAFFHTSKAGKGKANKAHFRRENNIRPIIDLTPHKLETFKTAKANHHYKFSKGH